MHWRRNELSDCLGGEGEFIWRRMPSDADADDTGSGFIGKAHCGIDMAGATRTRGAGCAAGDQNALHIKAGDGLFGRNSGQQQRSDAGQKGLPFTKACDAAGFQFGNEAVKQRLFALGTGFHIGCCQLCGGVHAADGRRVFCSGAQTALLTAAQQQRRECRAVSDEKCTDAARTIELVRGEAQGVAAACGKRHVTEGGDGISVEMNAAGFGNGICFSNRLEDAGFVVGGLKANEPRIRPDGGGNRFR